MAEIDDFEIDLARWVESLHPRDRRGRFAKKASSVLRSLASPEQALWAVAVPEVRRSKNKKAMTVEQRAAIRKKLLKNPVKSTHITKTFREATPGELEAGLNWYRNAHKIAVAMAEKHNVDVRTAAGLLAVYSPQTPWGQNTLVAHEVLRRRTPVGGPGAHVMVDTDALGDVEEKRRGVMSPAIRREQARRLLEGEEFHDVFAPITKTGKRPPKSLKIRAFGELIANGGQQEDGDLVVIDRHAAGVARGIRLEDNDFEVDGPSSSGSKYKVYADAYRRAAKALSKERGETITAEQVQAVTWLVRQRLNNAVRAREALGRKDAEAALHYFAQIDPDIAEIFGQGMVGYTELSNLLDETLDLANWDPAKHPRDPRTGRFVKSPVTMAIDTVQRQIAVPPVDLEDLVGRYTRDLRRDMYAQRGLSVSEESDEALFERWQVADKWTKPKVEEEIKRRLEVLASAERDVKRAIVEARHDKTRDRWSVLDEKLGKVPGGKSILALRDKILQDKVLDRIDKVKAKVRENGPAYVTSVATALAISQIFTPLLGGISIGVLAGRNIGSIFSWPPVATAVDMAATTLGLDALRRQIKALRAKRLRSV